MNEMLIYLITSILCILLGFIFHHCSWLLVIEYRTNPAVDPEENTSLVRHSLATWLLGWVFWVMGITLFSIVIYNYFS